jgi:glucose-6-phosphate isomerase
MARHDYKGVKGSLSVNPTTQSVTKRRAWKALVAHHQNVRELHLRSLFADDLTRGERMATAAVGLYLDYSKNRVTNETLKLLVQLADESGLRARIDAMFRGDKTNITENREARCRGRSYEHSLYGG